MQKRDTDSYTRRHLSSYAAYALVFLFFVSTGVYASVSGPCALCHTMHNSQNANDQASSGTGAGWGASGNISGGIDTSALPTLLKSDCIGCHSSTTSETLVDMNGSGVKVPIVFNTGGYPANPLAGGNFALNAGTADIYGHNVFGIAANTLDSNHSQAPGLMSGCGSSCHISLAKDNAWTTGDPGTGQPYSNGCQGCHTRTAHHNSADPSYRFLGGHAGGLMGNVIGTEDSNWERYKSSTVHNVYMRKTGVEDSGDMSIGHFCAGCHGAFHAIGGINKWGEDNQGDDNTDDTVTGGANAWLRHPSNVNIPDDWEYSELFLPGNNAYNPDIPVAQDLTSNTNIVNPGDQVTCITCHRAHASDKPDALRFDYSNMTAHSGESTEGCFYCHRTKDIP